MKSRLFRTRVFALVLALIMVAGILPAQIFAEGEAAGQPAYSLEEIEQLVGNDNSVAQPQQSSDGQTPSGSEDQTVPNVQDDQNSKGAASGEAAQLDVGEGKSETSTEAQSNPSSEGNDGDNDPAKTENTDPENKDAASGTSDAENPSVKENNDAQNPEDAKTQENTDAQNPEDVKTPENIDVQNPEDAKTPENTDAQNPEDVKTPENTDAQNPEDVKTPENTDAQNPEDSKTPENSDTQNPEDVKTPENTDAQNTEDAKTPENTDVQNPEDVNNPEGTDPNAQKQEGTDPENPEGTTPEGTDPATPEGSNPEDPANPDGTDPANPEGTDPANPEGTNPEDPDTPAIYVDGGSLDASPVGAYTASVSFGGSAQIPVGASFVMQEGSSSPEHDAAIAALRNSAPAPAEEILSPKNLLKNTKKALRSTNSLLSAGGAQDAASANTKVALSRTFDLSILDENGNPVQPADGSTVTVAISMPEIANPNLDVNVYHFKDTDGSLSAEKLPVLTRENETLTVETTGFSTFTVEFTYEGKQYVLQGEGEVLLSEVLTSIGITGNIEDVEVSDGNLFEANLAKDGNWYVYAIQPFTTTECMKVTVDGIQYEVTVTDAFYPVNGTADPTSIASSADIVSISINDLSKITGANREVTINGLTNSNTTGWVGLLSRNEIKNLGDGYNITIRYKNAAIFDGKACDVVIRLHDIILYGDTRGDAKGSFVVADIAEGHIPFISAGLHSPQFNSVDYLTNKKLNVRYGLEEKVTVSVYESDTTNLVDGTFMLTINDINISRSPNGSTSHIIDANNHHWFSEAISVNGDNNDVYFNQGDDNYKYLELDGNVIVRSGISQNSGSKSYLTGVVIVAKNGEASFTAYQSGGYNFADSPSKSWGANYDIMPSGDINHRFTSYAGAGGTLETNTKGTWTSDGEMPSGATILPSGTSETEPKVYVVPTGKQVSYKITPDDGYGIAKIIIDTTEITPDSNGNLTHPNLTRSSDGSYYIYTFPPATTTHKIAVEWEFEPTLPIGHVGIEPSTSNNVVYRNLASLVPGGHAVNTKLKSDGTPKKMGSLTNPPDFTANNYEFFTYALGLPLTDDEGNALGISDTIPNAQFYAASKDLAMRYSGNQFQYSVNWDSSKYNAATNTDTNTWETWTVKDENGDPTIPTVYAVYSKNNPDEKHVYITLSAIARNTTDPSFVDSDMNISFTETTTEYVYTVTINDPSSDTWSATATRDSSVLDSNTHTHKPGETHTHSMTYTTVTGVAALDQTQPVTITVRMPSGSVTETAPAGYELTSIDLKGGNRGHETHTTSSGNYTIYSANTTLDAANPVNDLTITRELDASGTGYIFKVEPKSFPENTEVEFINTRETVELTIQEIVEDPRYDSGTHDFAVTVRAMETWSDGRVHYSMLGTQTLSPEYNDSNGHSKTIMVPKGSDIMLIQRYGAVSASGTRMTEYDTAVESNPDGIKTNKPIDKEYQFNTISTNTTVTLRNTLKPRVVTIKKTMIGGDPATVFSFTAAITKADGTPLADTLIYKDDNGAEHKTDAQGKVSFNLSGNGTFNISVPYKAKIQVTEQPYDGVEKTEIFFNQVSKVVNDTTSGGTYTTDPITEDAEILFENTSEYSVYSDADRVTYEFYTDKSFDKEKRYYYTVVDNGVSDGEITSFRQILREGQVFVMPEQPPVPDGKVFLGWFDKNDTKETGFDKLVEFDSADLDAKKEFLATKGATVKLYAKFADAVFAIFHDNQTTETVSGETKTYWPVLQSVQVEKNASGKYVLDLTQYAPVADSTIYEFAGWSIEKNADPGTEISGSAATEYELTASTHFYPVFRQKVRVSFVTGETGSSAPYVPSVLVYKGSAMTSAQVPSPTWNGYTFAGWYYEPDYQTPYTQSDTFSADTILYAKWNMNEKADYRVIVWKQKVVPPETIVNKTDDYDYAYTYTVQNADVFTGNIVDGEKERAIVTAKEAQVSSKYTGNYAADFKHFNFTGAEQKMLMADGSTVINAYFDRDEYSMIIKRHSSMDPGAPFFEPAMNTGTSATLYGATVDNPDVFNESHFTPISWHQVGWKNSAGTFYGLDTDVYTQELTYVALPLFRITPESNENITGHRVTGRDGRGRLTWEDVTPVYDWIIGESYSSNPTRYSGTRYAKLASDVLVILTGRYESPLVKPSGYRYVKTIDGGSNNITPLGQFNYDSLSSDHELTAANTVLTAYAKTLDFTTHLEYYLRRPGTSLAESKQLIANGEIPVSLASGAKGQDGIKISNPNNKFPGYEIDSTYRSYYEHNNSSTTVKNWASLTVSNSIIFRPSGTNAYADSNNPDSDYIYHIQVVYTPLAKELIFMSPTTFGGTFSEIGRLGVYTDWSLSQMVSDKADGRTDYTTYSNTYASGKRSNGNKILTEGSYVFAGWYYDEACTQRFNPNAPVTQTTYLFAKWEKPWFVVQVDPAGGQLTGARDNGATWFWRQYGDTVSSYNDFITRDYDEHENGEFYYHVRSYSYYGGTYDYDSDYSVVNPNDGATYNLNDSTALPHSSFYDQDSSQPNDGKTYRYLPGVWKIASGWDYMWLDDQGNPIDIAGNPIGANDWSHDYMFDTQIAHNLKLRAVWEKVMPFKIVYDFADGTEIAIANTSPMSGLYSETDADNRYLDGAKVALTKEAEPNNSKLHFLGWKIKGGDGTLYPEGSLYTVSLHDVIDDMTITFVAQYGAVPLTSLVFDANGGKGNLTDLVAKDDTTQTVSSATNTIYDIAHNDTVTLSGGAGFERAGYTLIGWSKDPIDPDDINNYLYDTNNKRFVIKYYQYNSAEGKYERVIADGRAELHKHYNLSQKNVVVDGATDNKLYAVWNRSAVCKIVENNTEHIFLTINSAVKYARDNKSTLPMDATHPVTIQMLVDYDMPDSDKVVLEDGDNIVITTAKLGTDAHENWETYFFTPTFENGKGREASDAGNIAIIRRNYDGDSLITVENGAKLSLTKITLDGNKAVNKRTDGENGGVLYVDGGNAAIQTDATIRNSAAENGGAAYVAAGTLSMSGGTITSCEAKTKGDAVFVANDATFEMSGGSISGNTSNNGAVAVGGSGSKINLSGSPVISNNGSHGKKNLLLNVNSADVINVTSALTNEARIGVFVTGDTAPEAEPYLSRGGEGDQFGVHVSGAIANLNRFTNDRNDMVGAHSATDKIIWKVAVKVHEGQLFRDFTDAVTTISRDSSFTTRFEITEAAPKLMFFKTVGTGNSATLQSVELPVNTTIIMREADNTYYSYKLNSAASSIALSGFAQMGVSPASLLGNTDISGSAAQFVVDFSQVSGGVALNTLGADKVLTTGIGYGSATQAELSCRVTLVEKAAFTLADDNTADNLKVNTKVTVNVIDNEGYRANGGRATVWDKREMALVLTSTGTALPQDASIIAEVGGTSKTVYRTADGRFIIPLGAYTGDYSDIQIILSSNMFPATATEYTFSAKLMVANSLAEVSPVNGMYNGAAGAAATATLKFKSVASTTPSVKITTSVGVGAEQRTFKPGQTVTVNVKTEDAKAYDVYGTIYKKTGDTWTSVETVKAETKIKDAATEDSTFRTLTYAVPDSITADSSYRVDITVKDGTTTRLEVPYYFLVVTEE